MNLLVFTFFLPELSFRIYGLWCESNNVQGFVGCVEKLAGMDQAGLNEMGKRGRRFYEENYDVKVTYKAIAKHLGH